MTKEELEAEILEIKTDLETKINKLLADGNVEIGKRLGRIEDLEKADKKK